LCSALSIFLTDLCQHRVGKDAMTALCERSPRFRNNSVLLHKRKCILLLKERMKFNLVYCRLYFHSLTEVCKTCRIEVAYADGTELSFLISLLHRAVCSDVISHRLMDQVQIQIVQSKIVKRCLDRFLCFLIACILYPQFCGDEQLPAGNAALFDCLADCFFIHICCRCIDQAVSACYGVQNR